jgi:hypothetical protein
MQAVARGAAVTRAQFVVATGAVARWDLWATMVAAAAADFWEMAWGAEAVAVVA